MGFAGFLKHSFLQGCRVERAANLRIESAAEA